MALQFLQITQYDAAMRQLDAAIRMYLNEEDPVATHTVVCAAQELFDKLLKEGGKPSSLDTMKSYIREDKRDEVIDQLRKPQNFFKHGGEKDESVKFNPESVRESLLLCCISVQELGIEPTKEVRVFQVGYAVNNPGVLIEGEYKTNILKLRGNIPDSEHYVSKLQLLGHLKELNNYQLPTKST